MEESIISLHQRVLDHFGYLVLSSATDDSIGDRISLLTTDTPFEGEVVVIAKATVEDMLEQLNFCNKPPFIWTHHKYFFKVKAE